MYKNLGYEIPPNVKLSKESYVNRFATWKKPIEHTNHKCTLKIKLLLGQGFKAIIGYECDCKTFHPIADITDQPNIIDSYEEFEQKIKNTFGIK